MGQRSDGAPSPPCATAIDRQPASGDARAMAEARNRTPLLRPFHRSRRGRVRTSRGRLGGGVDDQRHPLPLSQSQALGLAQARAAARCALPSSWNGQLDRRGRLLPPAARARPNSASGSAGRGGDRGYATEATPRRRPLRLRHPQAAGLLLVALRRQFGLGRVLSEARLRAGRARHDRQRARGHDVEAVTYWLTAERAMHVLPAARDGARDRAALARWLSRLAGWPA